MLFAPLLIHFCCCCCCCCCSKFKSTIYTHLRHFAWTFRVLDWLPFTYIAAKQSLRVYVYILYIYMWQRKEASHDWIDQITKRSKRSESEITICVCVLCIFDIKYWYAETRNKNSMLIRCEWHSDLNWMLSVHSQAHTYAI